MVEQQKPAFTDRVASNAPEEVTEEVEKQFEGTEMETEITAEEKKDLHQFETLKKPDEQVEFDKVKLSDLQGEQKVEFRRIPIPRNRFTPLKQHWDQILKVLVEHMKLQVRVNTKRRQIEMRTSPQTQEISAIQKAADFLKAFMLGFELQDAIAILRLDDLYMETFEIKDVKTLHGDHLSRCIGRICGEKGKTRFAIENATRTRIVIQETKIHLLGTFTNIQFARDAICRLIMGSPPGKIYAKLRNVSKRLNERM